MASTYFNPDDVDDQRLLPAMIRGAQDLAEAAASAEADVLNEFTVAFLPDDNFRLTYRPATQLAGTNRWVFLRGYTEDPDDPAVDAGLKMALKRAIAEVVRWRLRTWKIDPTVQAQGTGEGASISYRENTVEPFPLYWSRWLQAYDTREPAWGF